MKRALFATILVLPLLLAACAGPDTAADDNTLKPGPGGPDPEHLTDIRYYNTSLGVGDFLVTITPAGQMTVQERQGAAANEVQRSTMQLSADQISNLQTLFKGWKKLPANHPGDWASMVQITYDGYQVEIHDLQRAPKQYTDIMATLNNYARQAVAQATRPAGTPAN